MVMASGRSSLPILTEAIAGKHLPASWMADPDVHRIYRIWMGIDSYDVISAPLVRGKEVSLDPRLGPAVERIAMDPHRRKRALDALPALARRLLEEVATKRKIRMDRWGVPNQKARPARVLLQQQLLVTSSDIHTERGYHTAIVLPWSASDLSKRFAAAAKQLEFDEAADELILAAVRSAVIAPEREARRWFVFGEARLDAMLVDGKIGRFSAEKKTWLFIP